MNGNTPIVVNINTVNVNFKKDLSDFEIRGIISYLDDYLEELYKKPYSSESYFQLAYTNGLLTSSNQFIFPDAPLEVAGFYVSHFTLSDNNVLYVCLTQNEERAYVRIN